MKKSKILGGVAAGAALAVAATLFLRTKTGKKLKEDVSEKVAEFYKYVSPKLKKLGEMTEAEYKIFMKKAVEEFTKAKKLSSHIAERLMEETKTSWKHLSNNSNRSKK